jgi:hypothetical protein
MSVNVNAKAMHVSFAMAVARSRRIEAPIGAAQGNSSQRESSMHRIRKLNSTRAGMQALISVNFLVGYGMKQDGPMRQPLDRLRGMRQRHGGIRLLGMETIGPRRYKSFHRIRRRCRQFSGSSESEGGQ